METLYQVVAALISVMLIAIIWYFWNDPGQWRKFKKEFKDAFDRLMADHQHPPNIAAFPPPQIDIPKHLRKLKQLEPSAG
jgi:4-amino-4-deoxy-L-arabinose transferase-like glycosyltransferase